MGSTSIHAFPRFTCLDQSLSRPLMRRTTRRCPKMTHPFQYYLRPDETYPSLQHHLVLCSSTRHASTTTTVKKGLPPPTTESAKVSKTDSSSAKSQFQTAKSVSSRVKLNPPPETYAPPLHVPPRRPNQNYAAYLWNAGKAYIAFYKAGIANVRATARIAKQLRAKATSLQTNDSFGIITRAEWQITRRSKLDMLRLPAFGTLVLLMGEWLPLVAFYITPLIPEPCRIPAQMRRVLEKKERRRQERERRIGVDAARLIAKDRKIGVGQTSDRLVKPQNVRLEELDHLDLFNLLTLSSKLDAHSRIWDILFLTPPKTLLRFGVGRKLAYIQKDDRLIKRDGGWQALSEREVERACTERGINVLARSEADLRADLGRWYKK